MSEVKTNNPLGVVTERMMNYLPQYWHEIEDMRQILRSQGIEFESLTNEVKKILDDAFILTASESRIAEWEKRLKLPPTGTLDQRRIAVLNYIATNSKLSGTSIKAMVASIYNGARSQVSVEDGKINVFIVPLPEYQMIEIDTSLLINQLESRKPCHIGVWAERVIFSWEDVRDGRLRSWGDINAKLKNWEEVLMYIPR